MSKPKHTPGPWAVEQVAGSTVYINQGYLKRRNIFKGEFKLPELALGDATLIAAAPCILEALEAMIETGSLSRVAITDLQTDLAEDAAYLNAYAALKKAKGDQ